MNSRVYLYLLAVGNPPVAPNCNNMQGLGPYTVGRGNTEQDQAAVQNYAEGQSKPIHLFQERYELKNFP